MDFCPRKTRDMNSGNFIKDLNKNLTVKFLKIKKKSIVKKMMFLSMTNHIIKKCLISKVDQIIESMFFEDFVFEISME